MQKPGGSKDFGSQKEIEEQCYSSKENREHGMKMERDTQAGTYKPWQHELCSKMQWEVIEGFKKDLTSLIVEEENEWEVTL